MSTASVPNPANTVSRNASESAKLKSPEPASPERARHYRIEGERSNLADQLAGDLDAGVAADAADRAHRFRAGRRTPSIFSASAQPPKRVGEGIRGAANRRHGPDDQLKASS